MRATREGRPQPIPTRPLPEAQDPVTNLRLARELLHADRMYELTTQQALWDRVEAWQSYRERVFNWRFDLNRGRGVRHLQCCPFCGHVEQLEPGQVRCWACDDWFIGLNP